MASIANDPGGRRRILFFDSTGERKAIRLGKISQRMADAVKFRAEQLVAAKLTGHAVDSDTARWVADLEPALSDKLARVGLIASQEPTVTVTIGKHLDDYFARRTDVKPNTLVPWRQAQRDLLKHFGADRSLATITVGEARDWERWLRTAAARTKRSSEHGADEGLASNTVRKRINDAKQFFQDAVDRELIAKNPFSKLSGAIGNNRSRDHFINSATAAKVLEACPDIQWRLLFALSRYGGLRCPSEHLALTWADVNWETGRFLVRSSKTEHHEGKGSRLVPIFPELRPYLEAAFDEAPEGAIHIITRYRGAGQNLRTQFERIIRRAGLEPWPKLFQNLRASRETELAETFPIHVVTAWIGNSERVANKHYLQVTDGHFNAAVQGGAESGALAAQNRAQQAHAGTRKKSHAKQNAAEKAEPLPLSATCGETLPQGSLSSC